MMVLRNCPDPKSPTGKHAPMGILDVIVYSLGKVIGIVIGIIIVIRILINHLEIPAGISNIIGIVNDKINIMIDFIKNLF
jgi:hypothetical protein